MARTILFPLLISVSARTPSGTEHSTTHTPTLSLYVTCLMLDYPNAEYEIAASMLAAIKCQDDRIGERGARADWAWDFWQTEWTFRQDNEVWGKLLLGCIFRLRISDSRRRQNVPCLHSHRCSRTQEFVKRTRSWSAFRSTPQWDPSFPNTLRHITCPGIYSRDLKLR